MWIKTQTGVLLNLDNVLYVEIVVFEQAYGRNYRINAYSGATADNEEGYLSPVAPVACTVAEFNERKAAQNYFKKLSAKLGADVIEIDAEF